MGILLRLGISALVGAGLIVSVELLSKRPLGAVVSIAGMLIYSTIVFLGFLNSREKWTRIYFRNFGASILFGSGMTLILMGLLWVIMQGNVSYAPFGCVLTFICISGGFFRGLNRR